MRKILLLTGAAIAVVGVAAIAASAPSVGHARSWQSDGESMRGHGRRGGGAMMMLQRFDTDGDGTVTQAEVDAQRADALARFDVDGDGALSLEEFQPLWLEIARPRLVDGFQRLDEDGDGLVTEAEMEQQTREMFARGDRNGDGALSREDMRRR